MHISLFDFHLPRECIAERPASPRDSARLLEVTPDGLHDRTVRDLPDLLNPGDILVFNDTRVIPARLKGKRGDAKVEITLHKQDSADSWHAFAKPARKLKPGDVFRIADDFSATVTAKGEDGEVTVRFDCSGPELMAKLIEYGEMPLPPYIPRETGADSRDDSDYQTLYAKHDGAVAAPTAGLHFTEELFARLDAKGVQRAFVTLHVGAGTFLPVKAENTADHRMHAEYCVISATDAEIINQARRAGGRVVAVGTTSLRTLESAADESGIIKAFQGDTSIFITPGYRFKAVDLLFTNFHLPKSTLFMLVSAFSGLDTMQNAYAHAISTGY
ncbi:MAG: tRNA preQ1(34) S-adenosylmethionine ribosyltransferase-isomerase QueA, partial [Alphaproteobacteria bacterium]|nr:tRNA preQ1(34) S-adenosylmethionine ribosyltransferase-isomerase QueA [Alphaproteobacteria bacterium]